MENINGSGGDNIKLRASLDASSLPTMRCIACGNYTFNASYVVKKVSALVSPNGKETLAPIQVFTCTTCASILPVGNDDMSFLSDIKEELKKENNKSDKKIIL